MSVQAGALNVSESVMFHKDFIKAKWDALKGLKKALKKRRQIQRSRIVVDDYIWILLEKELFLPRLTKRLRKN